MDLPKILIQEEVRRALLEDLGRAGDLSTQATIDPGTSAKALFVAREAGVVCGLPHAGLAFESIDSQLLFDQHVSDGEHVSRGTVIASVSGHARSILSAERTALNFMCHLSGISTLTSQFVTQIAHTEARMCCTRKTIPGFRASQKYAVRCGGGSNHRFGLDDAILIKDNHIAVAGGITKALEAAKAFAGHLVKIEIEVDTLDQFEEALMAGADCVLLDNFSADLLKEAVQINRGRAALEASGGVKLETVKAIAESGVDYISSSQITMSASTFDIGLDIQVR
ncbi:MAG: carboxylating nicotinate-nucleotide diphosphorylase [Luminiphilus sp.]|nr:carboxylating nicotinate-nucleotide diphosphorylase [Luminiphilus sp.]